MHRSQLALAVLLLAPATLPAQSPTPAAGAPRQSFELAGARELEVLVHLPRHLPADERAELVLLAGAGRAPVDLPFRASRVGRGGADVAELAEGLEWAVRGLAGEPGTSVSVQVPVPADAGFAAAFVRGRYLFSGTVSLVPGAEPAQPAELTPRLGAWITGRGVLPEGAEPPSEVRAEVLYADTADVYGLEDGGLRCDDLALDLRGLNARFSASLVVHARGLRDASLSPLALRPGEHRELELPFPRGATLSGHVRGEGGAPLSGAVVLVKGSGEWPNSFPKGAASDADGSFRIGGLRPGDLSVLALAPGQRTLELDVSLQADEERGIELFLVRGAAVSGRVTWPDGRPAQDVRVEAEVEPPLLPAWTDGDGRFTLGGLGERGCRLVCSARVADSGDEHAPVALRPEAGASATKGELARLARRDPAVREREGATTWTAVARGAPGGADLGIRLRPPLAIRGTVVDDTGAPVPRFTVVASSLLDGREIERDAVDGAFELRGLAPGRWEVYAVAVGYDFDVPSVHVRLPGRKKPLRLVLPRDATISGFVNDPEGERVAGATVLLSTAGPVTSVSSVRTDGTGWFTFDEIAPGKVELRARRHGWAESEALTYDLVPGDAWTDVPLTLRVGGRIVGEVRDEAGEPRSDVQVWIPSQGVRTGDELVSPDAEGRFALEDVLPGEQQVVVQPRMDLRLPEDMLRALQQVENDPKGRRVKSTAVTVEVPAGGEVHVTITAPRKAPADD